MNRNKNSDSILGSNTDTNSFKTCITKNKIE